MGRKVAFNPKMQTDWIQVVIPDIGANTRYQEMTAWCNDNTHGRHTFGRRYDAANIRYINTYLFKNKNDALLFKLTWGGDV